MDRNRAPLLRNASWIGCLSEIPCAGRLVSGGRKSQKARGSHWSSGGGTCRIAEEACSRRSSRSRRQKFANSGSGTARAGSRNTLGVPRFEACAGAGYGSRTAQQHCDDQRSRLGGKHVQCSKEGGLSESKPAQIPG